MLRVTPARGELLVRVPPLRRQHRQAAQALDAAEAGGALEDLQAIEEPLGARPARRRGRRRPCRRSRVICFVASAWSGWTRGPGSRPSRRGVRSASQRATAMRVGVVALHPHRRASSGRGRSRTPRADRAMRAEQPARLLDSAHQRAGPASAPAVTSLWPFRYLVTLCMTRSTPSAIGCWLIGLANVLSMIEMTPRRAAGAGDRRDVDAAQRRVDRRLEPDDLRRIADARRSGVAQLVERDEARLDAVAAETDRRAGAACRRRSPRCRRLRRPPSAGRAARWTSPPCPLDSSNAVSAPSSAAIVFSTATIVGLP